MWQLGRKCVSSYNTWCCVCSHLRVAKWNNFRCFWTRRTFSSWNYSCMVKAVSSWKLSSTWRFKTSEVPKASNYCIITESLCLRWGICTHTWAIMNSCSCEIHRVSKKTCTSSSVHTFLLHQNRLQVQVAKTYWGHSDKVPEPLDGTLCSCGWGWVSWVTVQFRPAGRAAAGSNSSTRKHKSHKRQICGNLDEYRCVTPSVARWLVHLSPLESAEDELSRASAAGRVCFSHDLSWYVGMDVIISSAQEISVLLSDTFLKVCSVHEINS